MSSSDEDLRMLLAEIGGHLSQDEFDAAIRKTRGLQSELMQQREGGGNS